MSPGRSLVKTVLIIIKCHTRAVLIAMKTAIKCVKKGKCFPRRLSEMLQREKAVWGESAAGSNSLPPTLPQAQKRLVGRRTTGQQRKWASWQVAFIVPSPSEFQKGSRCDTQPPSWSSLATWHVDTPRFSHGQGVCWYPARRREKKKGKRHMGAEGGAETSQSVRPPAGDT